MNQEKDMTMSKIGRMIEWYYHRKCGDYVGRLFDCEYTKGFRKRRRRWARMNEIMRCNERNKNGDAKTWRYMWLTIKLDC